MQDMELEKPKKKSKGQNKEGRQIKLDLKGAMRECVERDSERNFRSCTQQIYYILSLYYGENGFRNAGFVNNPPQIKLNESVEESDSSQTSTEKELESKAKSATYDSTNEDINNTKDDENIDSNEDDVYDDYYEDMDDEDIDDSFVAF